MQEEEQCSILFDQMSKEVQRITQQLHDEKRESLLQKQKQIQELRKSYENKLLENKENSQNSDMNQYYEDKLLEKDKYIQEIKKSSNQLVLKLEKEIASLRTQLAKVEKDRWQKPAEQALRLKQLEKQLKEGQKKWTEAEQRNKKKLADVQKEKVKYQTEIQNFRLLNNKKEEQILKIKQKLERAEAQKKAALAKAKSEQRESQDIIQGLTRQLSSLGEKVADLTAENQENMHLIHLFVKSSDIRMNNPEMNTSGQCKICYQSTATIAYVQCGHLCLCFDCSKAMKNDKCPLCRKKSKRHEIFSSAIRKQ